MYQHDIFVAISMVKAYLRYEHESSFGCIVSEMGNSVMDPSGTFAFSAANEAVSIINIRTHEEAGRLTAPKSLKHHISALDTSINARPPQVTYISEIYVNAAGEARVAVGYSDGSIATFTLNFSGSAVETAFENMFRGHKSGINALVMEEELLVSGGERH